MVGYRPERRAGRDRGCLAGLAARRQRSAVLPSRERIRFAALAQAAGLVLTDVYYADGRSQKLNLFGVLRPSSYSVTPT